MHIEEAGYKQSGTHELQKHRLGLLITSTSLNLHLYLHPSQGGRDTMVIHAMESMSSPKDNAAREG